MNAKERRRRRQQRAELTPNGMVRGYHGRCPAASPGFFGTYELTLDDEEHIVCSACGAHDLELATPCREELTRP